MSRVSPIAYRNLLVIDPRTNESPILLGPILVHQRKTFETYHFFASTLVGLSPSFATVLAFGTDGEEVLVKAFKQQLQRSIHLRCFRHMKQDIQRKLRDDMGFPGDAVTEITSHIFGVKQGPTFHEGLVDSTSEAEFMSKLQSLESTWGELSQHASNNTGKQLGFYQWFLKYHAKEIMETMLRPVREAAGLGDPPSEFCTNDSESINSSLKQFLGFKKSEWPVFNDKMRKFVCDQQEEVCKAIVGVGQYIIRDEYKQLTVASSRWFTTFTEEQKARVRKKFQHASVDDVDRNLQDLREACLVHSIEDVRSAQSLPRQKELSVDIEVASNVTGLPSLIVRRIWAKAVDLVFSTGQVAPAPGCSTMSRMVASSSQKKPHFVSVASDGRFECDDNCPAFQQRYMCSHSVAAAEDNGMLTEFLHKYGAYAKTAKGKRSVTPNFTRLSMANLPRGTAGKKGGKPPKKKAVSRRTNVPEEQRQPMIQTTPTNTGSLPASTSNPSISGVVTDGLHSYTNPTTSGSLPLGLLASVTSSPYSAIQNWNWHWQGAPSCPPLSGYSPTPSQVVHNVLPSQFLHNQPLADVTNYPYRIPGSSSQASNADVTNSTYYPYRIPGSSSQASNPGFSATNASISQSGQHTFVPTKPFVVKFLNGRIKVCAGCKGPHMKDISGHILPPPYDLCIMHTELLNFVNPRTGMESSKIGNAYYHVNSVCIQRKHPNFATHQLVVPEEVQMLLKPQHYQLLYSVLGFVVSHAAF